MDSVARRRLPNAVVPRSEELRQPLLDEVGQIRLCLDRVDELRIIGHRDRVELERDQGKWQSRRRQRAELGNLLVERQVPDRFVQRGARHGGRGPIVRFGQVSKSLAQNRLASEMGMGFTTDA